MLNGIRFGNFSGDIPVGEEIEEINREFVVGKIPGRFHSVFGNRTNGTPCTVFKYSHRGYILVKGAGMDAL